MKKYFLLIFTIATYSCGNTLKNQKVKNTDTLPLGYVLGMDKFYVGTVTADLKGEGKMSKDSIVTMEVDGLRFYAKTVFYYGYDSKLSAMQWYVYPEDPKCTDFKSRFIKMVSAREKCAPTMFGAKNYSSMFWLNGDLRVDFFESEKVMGIIFTSIRMEQAIAKVDDSLNRLQQAYESSVNAVYSEVTQQLIEEYNIAKRQGDKMQTYVSAGMVCQGMLSDRNELGYRKWKEIEKQCAVEVGIRTY